MSKENIPRETQGGYLNNPSPVPSPISSTTSPQKNSVTSDIPPTTDFDRSWPKRDGAEGLKSLFNERLGKFEPFSVTKKNDEGKKEILGKPQDPARDVEFWRSKVDNNPLSDTNSLLQPTKNLKQIYLLQHSHQGVKDLSNPLLMTLRSCIIEAWLLQLRERERGEKRRRPKDKPYETEL
jgi:hypothetical protein